MEKARTGVAAFLGMELDGEDILFFDDGGEIRSVCAESDHFPIGVGGGERVCEIKIRIGRDAFEKSRRVRELELVPPHVRELDCGGERANGTGQEMKARKAGRFCASFVKRLQAEANAEEGNGAM